MIEQPYIETAHQSFDSAVQRYLVWMVEYQFPTLTAFFQKLEDLIVKVHPQTPVYSVPL